jgi:triosephosphate isomerase
MKRKNIAAANWKMNTTVQEGVALLEALCSYTLEKSTEVIVCAPATHLYALSMIDCPGNVHIGGQNMSNKDSGAYTGEISAQMLLSVGVTHVVIGHSERRQYFGESDELLGSKLRTALDNGLTPIFCCGEGLDIRRSGNHVNHVIGQIEASLVDFSADEVAKMVIAYEPIWAIGTGETASPAQAQEMHAAIRAHLDATYGYEIAQSISILYGGSVKPANGQEIFSQTDVDGGLVGGASLDAESFAKIVNSF